ncbi:MAG TPA: BTAD domain-containing putative transcriptional regulator [Micromonosporaceae bacterium]|nr:BTAD domain-containing putative transcriptional regulator [Micromonosporaceae bacterium]
MADYRGAADHRVHVQLCGQVALEVDGERRETGLPGRQGRMLLAYTVLRRHDPLTRDELCFALWGDDPPRAVDSSLGALLSRLRKVLAPVPVDRTRIVLPPGAWVDLEGAREAIHRAESALVRADLAVAWSAAQTSLFVARRGFLAGEDRPWIDEVRAELQTMRERALEAYAAAAVRLGGTELATAERASRELVGLAPYRESAYRLLMNALVAQGNGAEAMRVYDALLRRLRDDLGVRPSTASQALHAELLARFG